MKKFVALLLAVLMVASLCACGQKDTQTASDIKTVTAGKLTMSTNAQFPPYESVADDGKGYEAPALKASTSRSLTLWRRSWAWSWSSTIWTLTLL